MTEILSVYVSSRFNDQLRSEAREGNNPDPISVATHSSDEMLPTTLATLREINRKLIAESLDVEPADDEKSYMLRNHHGKLILV